MDSFAEASTTSDGIETGTSTVGSVSGEEWRRLLLPVLSALDLESPSLVEVVTKRENVLQLLPLEQQVEVRQINL